MGNHHEPFQALGPIDWDNVPQDSLKLFLDATFADAQTIIESIPSPTTTTATPAGRARSKTDSAIHFAEVQRLHPQRQSGASLATAQQLRKEWKDVKVNARDNPLGISVYKLASKDGKGAWFARRSVHEGLSFDVWKIGLDREFPETMKVQGSPGSGNIRGIGADKIVENRSVDGAGHLGVFQLSAQFPGPTSPRDFITLLLTSDFSHKPTTRSRLLRQYIIVSKPCIHPECPQRQGIIRGQYESVELIRELPLENDSQAVKRSLPPTTLGGEDNRRSSLDLRDDCPLAIEWLMVTRSDPGGSVPRFMVEKGTPPGIVGDAGKFVNWITAKSADNILPTTEDDSSQSKEAAEGGIQQDTAQNVSQTPDTNTPHRACQVKVDDGNIPSSNGIYGIISGVFGVASSVVTSGLRQFGSPAGSHASQEDLHEMTEEPEDAEEEDDETVSSETSSIRTFASAVEKTSTAENRPQSIARSNSDEPKSHGKQSLEKELSKLQDKRRKLDEKAVQMQERLDSKRRGGKGKDEAVLAKMREKHEKEIAKQEAKYKRELQKLEEKREQEERKAEARRRKTLEREEKFNLTMELEKLNTERDVALKRVEILQGQVGELQSQNTMLVAKLGKMGGIDRAASSSKGSEVGSIKSV